MKISVGSIWMSPVEESYFWIACSEKGIIQTQFAGSEEEFKKSVLQSSKRGNQTVEFLDSEFPILVKTKMQLREYFEGKRKSIRVPLDFEFHSFPSFTKQVYQTLGQVPYGEVISYQELGRWSGSPRAFRAVGNIMGKNPFPILVPCHRVIHRDGTIGGFSSSLHFKAGLIRLESGKKNLEFSF